MFAMPCARRGLGAKNWGGGDLKVAARSLTGEGGIIMQRTTGNPTCWSHAPGACTPHSTTSSMLSYSAGRGAATRWHIGGKGVKGAEAWTRKPGMLG